MPRIIRILLRSPYRARWHKRLGDKKRIGPRRGELPGVSSPPASFNTNTADFPSDPPRRKPPARLNSAQNRYSPSAVRLVTLLPGKSVSLALANPERDPIATGDGSQQSEPKTRINHGIRSSSD